MDGTFMGGGLIIEHNEISNNTYSGTLTVGGGIGMYSITPGFTINANIIKENDAHYGGGICSKETLKVEITNNLIAENTAVVAGGGLFFTDDVFDELDSEAFERCRKYDNNRPADSRAFFPLVINNTITANTSQLYGGGMATHQKILYILSLNNIFWENIALECDEIFIYDDCDFYLYYCNVDLSGICGEWTGTGNVFGDPLFCDDSCHLQAPSGACYNTGKDTIKISGITYYAPLNDIDGEVRPLDTLFDIGADEDSLDYNPAIYEYHTENSLFDLHNVPNPFQGITQVNYRISETSHVTIRIFSQSGQHIETLLDRKQIPGEYQLQFNSGNLQAGIYFCHLVTPSGMEIQKMLILNN